MGGKKGKVLYTIYSRHDCHSALLLAYRSSKLKIRKNLYCITRFFAHKKGQVKEKEQKILKA